MNKYAIYFAAVSLLWVMSCTNNSQNKPVMDSSSDWWYSAADDRTKAHLSVPKFEFIYLFGESMTILEEHKPGIPITLLEIGKPRLCKTKTGEILKEYSDYLGVTILYTKLLPAADCGFVMDYSLSVVRNKVEQYDIIPVTMVEDERLARSLDRKIKATDVLQKLLLRSGGIKYEVQTLKPPVVYRYAFPGLSVYVVQYGFKKRPGLIGPRVVVIDDSIYPLTGQCSYSHLRGFRLNSDYYIETGSSCCDCGITGQEVFQITPTSVELVFKDFRLSG